MEPLGHVLAELYVVRKIRRRFLVNQSVTSHKDEWYHEPAVLPIQGSESSDRQRCIETNGGFRRQRPPFTSHSM